MKRIQELRLLSEDHHHGLVLARRACRAARGEKGLSVTKVWGEIEQKFRDELEPHFQIEEKHLAPPLGSHVKLELLSRFFRDHQLLRYFVYDRTARTQSALREFGETLERHIRFEERELFEIAQKCLSSDQLKAIESACSERPVHG